MRTHIKSVISLGQIHGNKSHVLVALFSWVVFVCFTSGMNNRWKRGRMSDPKYVPTYPNVNSSCDVLGCGDTLIHTTIRTQWGGMMWCVHTSPYFCVFLIWSVYSLMLLGPKSVHIVILRIIFTWTSLYNSNTTFSQLTAHQFYSCDSSGANWCVLSKPSTQTIRWENGSLTKSSAFPFCHLNPHGPLVIHGCWRYELGLCTCLS